MSTLSWKELSVIASKNSVQNRGWISWGRISKPTREGGLGIRSLPQVLKDLTLQ